MDHLEIYYYSLLALAKWRRQINFEKSCLCAHIPNFYPYQNDHYLL